MNFTPKRGLFRIVVAAITIAFSLLFAESFSFLVVCTVLVTGLVLYWLISGFFDTD
jgi:hypothetical protein